MKRIMLPSLVGCLLLLIGAGVSPLSLQPGGVLQSRSKADGQWLSLDYAPAPADNPLKGFMPFYDAYGSADTPIANDFPHSMEYFYVPLRDLMNGPNSFTFATAMEPQLQSINNWVHQAVMLVYLDY